MGEYIGEVGEYIGEVGLTGALFGSYAGEVGEYIGDVGEYIGEVGLTGALFGSYTGEVGEYIGDVGLAGALTPNCGNCTDSTAGLLNTSTGGANRFPGGGKYPGVPNMFTCGLKTSTGGPNAFPDGGKYPGVPNADG